MDKRLQLTLIENVIGVLGSQENLLRDIAIDYSNDALEHAVGLINTALYILNGEFNVLGADLKAEGLV
jgi:hypothetical protein